MSATDPFQELVDILCRGLIAPPSTTSTTATSASAPVTPAVLPCTSPMAKPAPFSGSAEDCNGFILQCSLVLGMQSSWRHWLEGAQHPFTVLTDHKNLEYQEGQTTILARHAGPCLSLDSISISHIAPEPRTPKQMRYPVYTLLKTPLTICPKNPAQPTHPHFSYISGH
ncbi:uncharacterized protein LOC122876766 isoform X2 [Siniperca chuatsi]|uniref:uncharacterized protein LOC122876766 isoform X2 n=1 Tax=Siniperca chuatsi TaxID=119488 RepID=UPI001CE10A5C|nr:uncharacterized protein LOC122876766 isoform X2 [Siniperca chuatsi]